MGGARSKFGEITKIGDSFVAGKDIGESADITSHYQ
jgi:hypothetical protein